MPRQFQDKLLRARYHLESLQKWKGGKRIHKGASNTRGITEKGSDQPEGMD